MRWEYNIETSPKIGLGGMNWVDLTQDRRAFVNTVMNLRVN
jgi:hypothetical protein